MIRKDVTDLIVRSIVPSLAKDKGVITEDRIKEFAWDKFPDMIAQMNGFNPLTDEERTEVQKELASRFLHVRDLNALVFCKPYEPWLETAKPRINPRFGTDYSRYLLDESRFSVDTVNSIESTTDRILDLGGDPCDTAIGLRKGLVVGNVQSGKTADYIGVIAKAADAGYRVIIVLSGMTNTLRSQTQERIDKGFVGVSTVEVPTQRGGERQIIRDAVGVGNDSVTNPRPLAVVSLTTLQSDFTGKTARSITSTHGINSNTVYIAVAKKNKNTLEALVKWFDATLCTYPMLFIDDEADNASINYSKDETPSTINGLIRKFLSKFPRATYIGYTATPFANIFIDPDAVTADHGEDLFPSDFVVALDVPDNYMGPSTVFGADVNPEESIVREIDDPKALKLQNNKGERPVVDLPPSLVKAVREYVLATAIRIGRGDATCHSSALINVNVRIAVHHAVAELVRKEVEVVKNAILVYGGLPYDHNEIMTDLHSIFEAEYKNCGLLWGTVQKHLHDAVARVEVLEVHMKAEARQLDYSRAKFPNGRRVIAIGGFSVSRGLTLEGLCVSYLLRNTKMYDTLMQMGRWFGYRRGYQDICRIHLTREAHYWYRHITAAMEELWDEFAEMSRANLTPSQFGLRVQAHPLNLIVTARNKMRATSEIPMKVDLTGRHVEPSELNIRDLAYNRGLLDELVKDIGTPNGDAAPSIGYFWKESVSISRVQDFIRSFKRRDGNMDTAPGPLCAFLDKFVEEGISSCDVYLVSLADERDYSVAGLRIRREKFTIEVRQDGTILIGGARKHVTSKDQERAGLGDLLMSDDVKRQMDEYTTAKGTQTIPGRFYRRFRKNPLLVLHVVNGMVDAGKSAPVVDCSEIVVWRLVFPGDATSYQPDRLVSYVLNPIAARQYFQENGDEEGEEE